MLGLFYLGQRLQRTTNYVLHFFGPYKTGLVQYLAHIRTLLQAPVTQPGLRPLTLDKDPAVDESSNFLCIFYFAMVALMELA